MEELPPQSPFTVALWRPWPTQVISLVWAKLFSPWVTLRPQGGVGSGKHWLLTLSPQGELREATGEGIFQSSR